MIGREGDSWPHSVIVIAAVAKNGVIGKDGKIPWKSSWDWQQFRIMTTGPSYRNSQNTLVMGRKTFESIGRPLPNRETIVVTRNPNLKIDGCVMASSLEDALRLSTGYEIFICGGAEIYREAMRHADKFVITRVDLEPEGDTFFPEMPPEFSATACHSQRPEDRKEGEPACHIVEYEHLIPGLDT